MIGDTPPTNGLEGQSKQTNQSSITITEAHSKKMNFLNLQGLRIQSTRLTEMKTRLAAPFPDLIPLGHLSSEVPDTLPLPPPLLTPRSELALPLHNLLQVLRLIPLLTIFLLMSCLLMLHAKWWTLRSPPSPVRP